MAADCFVCAKHEKGDAAPGGVLFQDDLVYAGHAYPIVVVPPTVVTWLWNRCAMRPVSVI